MSPARALLLVALSAVGCASFVASHACADEPATAARDDGSTTAARDDEVATLARVATVDRYARYSDGPRSVPRPRGAALARATALGLGTREAATQLLTRPPEARWLEAARGRRHRTLLWPVDGARFGRGFGFTRRERRELRHDGVDVAAPAGAEVRAVADGLVAYADNGVRGFGNCVMIVHANGWVSLYAHLSRATVQPGWRATRGERIGLVGSTGIARGPHLHFELLVGGRTRDPEPLFAEIPGRTRRGPAPTSPVPAPPAARTVCSRAGSPERCAPALDARVARR